MITEPKLEQRDEQPYVAIRTQVSMQELQGLPPQLYSKVLAWLGKKGLSPAGPPFIRFYVTDMERQLDLELGFPVASALPGDDGIQAGVVPAGRYLTCLYKGHYQGLMEATAAFLTWAEQNGIVWQTSTAENGQEVWGGRFEFYLTDPATEPDPQKWETELAFLTQPQATPADKT